MHQIRTIPFVDRFGREHLFVFLDEAAERICARVYGALWPKVKRHLGELQEIRENCKALVTP